MDATRARALLDEELAGLAESTPGPGAVTDGDRSGEGMDFGDSGSRTAELMDHDLAAGTLRGRRERLRAALDRLDRGEYGHCAECGREIDDERLEARPETDRCRDHPEPDRQLPGPVER